MRLLVGTSGYSYAPWKGSFYPEKLPAAKMLGYYAERLPAVEINNTFYKMPTPDILARWAGETPETFTFVLKSPRRITHDRRLADVEDSVKRFYEAAAALGARRGPVLFQLPPNMKKDVGRLDAFLKVLAATTPDARPAFEFRHDSWFCDEVFQTLKTGGAALCIAEDEDLATPLEPTAGWGYLRLRRQDYDDAALASWAERVHARASGWDTVYCFFKHEDEGRGPALAARMRELFERPSASGADVPAAG